MARIMVVSNQAYPRSLLCEALVGEGHNALWVDDAARVCRHCSRIRPEMVLLDLFMEGEDGWAIFHRVKCYAPEIPVLVYALSSTFDLTRLQQSVRAALAISGPAGQQPRTGRAAPRVLPVPTS